MHSNIIIPILLTFFAGLCTLVGSLVFLLGSRLSDKVLSFFLGLSAGAMVYLSFLELMPLAIKGVGFFSANIYFFLGILIIGTIDLLIPHHPDAEQVVERQKFQKLLKSGYLVALGIAIHNFPEGIAVFMSSYGNLKFGSIIALSTAVHNIPEGIAVASPVYFATKSKRKAFLYSFLAGIAEPLGAVVAFLLLKPYISDYTIAAVFAVVAGIMTYISFDELLPSCFEHCQGHVAMTGIGLGMAIIALSLGLMPI